MKTRHGFVSNSSSSSFVLFFEKTPKSVEELHALLFPHGPCSVADDLSSEAAATQVFNDLGLVGTPLPQAREELCHGTVTGAGWPEYPNYRLAGPARELAWKRYEEKRHEMADTIVSRLQHKYPEGKFFVVEYSDNDGTFFSSMEHGGVFDNLGDRAIRVSKH